MSLEAIASVTAAESEAKAAVQTAEAKAKQMLAAALIMERIVND